MRNGHLQGLYIKKTVKKDRAAEKETRVFHHRPLEDKSKRQKTEIKEKNREA